MGFGEALQRLREKKGLSQVALAERADLSLRSIQNWEQGHRTPRAETLLGLAGALGVSVEALLREMTEAAPPPKRPARKGKGK